MARKSSIYSDLHYERLRLRLLAFQREYSKSPQAIADAIVERTGYATTRDGGRKRVERFLTVANRVNDDFVAAVEAFLGDFQLIDYEDTAAAISKLTRGPAGTPTKEDIVRFAGVYHGKMTGLVTFSEQEVQTGEEGAPERMWETRTLPHYAYPVFRMTPMSNNAGLFVWVANPPIKPEDGVRPEDVLDVPLRGIASRFSKDGLLIIVREPRGSVFYNVKIESEEPFDLYGYGRIFSDDGSERDSTYPLLPFEPHCEIRMVRIKEQGED